MLRRIAVIALLGFAPLGLAQMTVVRRTGVASAFLNGYSYRRSITTDHTKVQNSDQTDFAVMFAGTYTYLKTVANGGKTQSDNDVIFASDDQGASPLPCEQVIKVATTGVVEYHVKLATLHTGSDDVFYMFYGKAGVGSPACASTGTWNSNYLGVYHLKDGTTLSVSDSTSNARNGTNTGPPTAVAGEIDGAAAFSGSGQYIDLSTSGLPTGAGTRTIECWANTQTTGGTFNVPLALGNNLTPDTAFFFGEFNGTLYAGGAGAPANVTPVAGFWSTNVWHHLVLTYDGSTVRLYTDGGANGAVARTLNLSYGVARIGSDSEAEDWNGYVDEVRISSVQLSADWISAEYNNQSSPSTFYAVGSEVTP